ncbi:MAG: bifunctional (p)ppGpp synthetase/guanosine-3',5'-bis(diphosphate) 3'-pyrophosphohydrolase [Proteobacteria bacterium]|jgi:GTP pyrophosphokinase|nr:GTP pyrophosphokinase [Methylibium sp.]MBY0367949.1 bifunctional (p)ppGpp synthetase/guanosine-3',5'-bis(diphosphate) 3'-pyrophosphohydrolase [Burkholderiaceae bacterium]MCH8855849.1 bifunctional (p)ppGpp synthetase/guanosine-3',5'-bis(diphosphate) 3'-pyrophosphohydrolase [Pseudomonadota bacterium]|mmetsp:Transcript_21669/g.84380  ORF Transcript_21669/g.84380 Transcript_21669/m.84380 type:complete len:753 (-) Transcript_21669:518-2776(-)
MKTGLMQEGSATAPIVALLDAGTAHSNAEVVRARAFAEPLLAAEQLDTGENALAHADGVAAILQGIGSAPELQAAAYLVYAGDFLNKPEEVVSKAFGDSYASLVSHTRKLVQLQRAARGAAAGGDRKGDQRAEQTERVRKMLLAFSRDLRVVLLRLASRLQTLRWFAAVRRDCPAELAEESLSVFAPLANRLGIWQIKWELEDLAFRFRDPDRYKALAKGLQETRVVREQRVDAARAALQADLQAQGIAAEVQGRPKHLYSIHKKMQGKDLPLERVFDLRALRVIVASVADCYAALARLHEVYTPVPGEFDDYIAKPKPNGYQSLHTVVIGADGQAMEVQVRTRDMHEHAEHGVAAHWAYKEAGARGYAGVSAAGEFEEQVARARKAVLNQLLAWERDAVHADGAAGFDDRIYVFTPQATIVELTAGATPVDFAYAVHTDLGHRCRGARIDGQMLPLNTPLRSGQTVEIIAAREGGPSLDWLNPELGYLQSQRSRAKVRAWFNALQLAQTVAKGRELVEKLLQREGKTALKLDELAARLGFKGADALFEVVGKDEYSLRNIELLLRPPEPVADEDELLAQKHTRSASTAGRGGVLVVGIDSLLTTLSRCCRPAPPDAIAGFVTRGKGVAIHRSDCSNLAEMRRRSPERVIAVAWGGADADGKGGPVYPVDVLVEGSDRQGLLRDVLEVFAKEKMNVVAVNTQSLKPHAAKPRPGGGDTAWMSFTLELADASRLAKLLRDLCAISGVRSARRR